jgi:serine/threonine-protein kinase
MSDTVVLPQSPLAGPQPGDIIAGRYRLERELGRGAMGMVWAAMHTTLGQRVAIKLIAGDKARSSEARHRFGLEAKAAARLRSRHVVQVYDDGETPDGTPYIVMEYLDGQTLEERLETQPDMGLGEAVRIASHVGRALARAHAQGIVHRDLKSGHIFIAKSDDDELGWVAKVLDFGVAKVLNEPSATRTGTIVGTPLFMSPEQIRGASHVDHRADLYSLGMVFYNMVTGSHAFDGPSYSDVLVAICTQSLPDIRTVAPWLPPALGLWFDKACARERDERFQSADEMIEALQQAAGPGTRLSRPSVPDEIGGPSGTLHGHVPPHTASTLLASEFRHPATSIANAPSTPQPARGADAPRSTARSADAPRPSTPGARHAEVHVAVHEQAPPSSRRTTLRSTPPDPVHYVKPPARTSLWVWAASGAGLAVATVLFVVVALRVSAWLRGPAPKTEPVHAATTAESAARPPATEPARADVEPRTKVTAPVAAIPVPAVATSPAPPTVAPAAPLAATSTHHTSTPVRRAAPLAPPAPRAVAAPAPPKPLAAAAKPPAAPAAPDMGF